MVLFPSYISIISGLSFILLAQNTFSQEIDHNYRDIEEKFTIEWVSQYPEISAIESKDSEKPLSRKSKWLSNLIFGKKPEILTKPTSIVAYNADSVFVADQGTGSIVKIIGKEGTPVRFRRSKTETFASLVGLCMLPDKRLLFSDSYLNRIFSFSPGSSSATLELIYDSLNLVQPTGIAWSETSNEIWVIETGAHRISIISADGSLIRKFGERGNAPGQFNYPTHIWIDKNGRVYITDALNFRIQIFNPMGDFISMFGEAGDASGFLSRPKGIATDSFGHIYIVDALFHVVQVFDNNGQFLYDFGGKGKEKEQFMIPTGIYIDDKDYIYIADSYNSRIQVFRIYQKD